MIRHLPNFLTCCNLLCGCFGIVVATYSLNIYSLWWASLFIFAACVFDFLDGFLARLLKVSSPIGKELDSLADVITFGVLPGLILFKLLAFSIDPLGIELVTLFNFLSLKEGEALHFALPLPSTHSDHGLFKFAPSIFFIGFLIPVFSAIRLAKFNIDTRQSDRFIGVPTPANAILIASFPLIIIQNKFNLVTSLFSNAYFLIVTTLVMSFLLVAELPLFALKFKSFKWADNKLRFSFLIVSALLLAGLTWSAIPFIILLYILLSIVANKLESAQA